MSLHAIRARDLAKKYRIHAMQSRHRYHTLRDTVAAAAKAPFMRLASVVGGTGTSGGANRESFWALDGLDFDIRAGEVVGLIGRNGAGKSTLLKIMSRIVEPTRGYAEIRGRIGSLLEVGTGFHPELTGRENTYLYGAILGMRRAEIERKFDEIVAFAEVERFLDTPVKHYSSGMYMRLAFAVAAHLETEILFVDEVLAVGDARFQRKCMSKMEDVGHQGRTVVFVSHNMAAVTRLCPRTILLDGGRIRDDGRSHDVVGRYLSTGVDCKASRSWPDPATAPGNEIGRLRSVRVETESGEIAETFDMSEPIDLILEYDVLQGGHVLLPHFHLYTGEGVHAFTSIDIDSQWRRRPRPPGRYVSRVHIPPNMLSEGMMLVEAAVITIEPPSTVFYEQNVIAFHVSETFRTECARGDWDGDMGGAMRPMFPWSTEYRPLVGGASEPLDAAKPMRAGRSFA
jgi:lipopolysaccharide transport system ATP-binding protein